MGRPLSARPGEERVRPGGSLPLPSHLTQYVRPTWGLHRGEGRGQSTTAQGPQATLQPSQAACWWWGGAHSGRGQHRVAPGVGHVGADEVVLQDAVNPVVIPLLGLQDRLLGKPLLGPVAREAAPFPLQDGVHVPAGVRPLVPGSTGCLALETCAGPSPTALLPTPPSPLSRPTPQALSPPASRPPSHVGTRRPQRKMLRLSAFPEPEGLRETPGASACSGEGFSQQAPG